MSLTLEATRELWGTAPHGKKIYYKRLCGSGDGINADITAAHVRVVLGRQAMNGDEWYKFTSNPALSTDAVRPPRAG